jgi:hypothetical protein
MMKYALIILVCFMCVIVVMIKYQLKLIVDL